MKNPSTPDKRKVIVKAKEAASDDTLVGDPVTNGATVTITANGATPSEETYTLPAGTSPTSLKPFWSGDAVKGFKYRDADGENGPVKSALIKLRNGVFQIKVTVDGKQGPVAVVPPNPGSDGCVLLTIAGGDSYSVQFASGQVTNKGAVLFKVAKPSGEGSCLPPATPTATTTPTSTATPTLELPHIPPPGPAPLRYRDLVFSTVSTTTNVIYGSAMNNSGQTVTLQLDIYEPTGDTVTERPAIVWVHGGSFCCGDKSSAEIVDEATTFARKGYFNVSINYRLEPGGCAGGPSCVIAIQEALDGRADCRPLPAYERGDLRHRRDSHRDRRHVRRRDHGAERRVQLQRRPDGRGGRGGVALRRAPRSPRSIPATRRACCSTARPTTWCRTRGR